MRQCIKLVNTSIERDAAAWLVGMVHGTGGPTCAPWLVFGYLHGALQFGIYFAALTIDDPYD